MVIATAQSIAQEQIDKAHSIGFEAAMETDFDGSLVISFFREAGGPTWEALADVLGFDPFARYVTTARYGGTEELVIWVESDYE